MRAVNRLLAVLLLSLAALPCAALDDAVAQALSLDLAASRLAAAPQAGFTVYVGSTAQDSRVREVWVQVDSQPLTRYLFSPREGDALSAGGLHVLLADTLAPGRHRIRAQAAAVGLDPRREDDRSRAQVEIHIDQGEAPVELELSWNAAAYVGKATLTAVELQRSSASLTPAEAAGGRYAAGSSRDPRLRAIRFLDATGRRYGAERAFRALQQALPGLPRPELANSADPPPAPAGDDETLAAIGGAKGCTEMPNLVCDRVNSTLGYALLDQGEGLKAADAFRRVRAPGPYATSALLGLGWALLTTPDGKAAAKAEPVVERPGREPRHQVRVMKPKEHADAIRAALVPWIELIGRDPTDPAVQEGQIAIAWALAELGAQVQAQDYFNRAITQLTDVLKHVEKAKAELAVTPLLAGVIADPPGEAWHWLLADRLPDPRWWVLPIGDAPETFHLEALLQQAAFRERLLSLRDLHEARASLRSQRERLGAVGSAEAGALTADIDRLLPALDAGIAEHSRQVDRLALAQLLAVKKQAQQALVEARFGLVQLYDRAAEVAAK
ncbi:MAG: hypothetical protein C0434_03565 [Xanthomonadaceae bacterium]|nr:hypothetical protein [Xanthomonadaceae bacterium]